MKNTSFRYDINGLRAYAVGLVVLFHFGIFGFSSGFIGVDIFFVISGYLMSKIIIEQLQNNKFSFLKFYLARAIRIAPALLFLTFILAIIGWYVLIPEEYKAFGKHAASSITFLSNLIYYQEAGDYFAANTHDKILLHTWSLSVEWQFYILLPVLFWLAYKLIKKEQTFKIVILLGFIISLAFSIYISNTKPIFSFFLLPTRAWEMLAGGIVYAYFSNLGISSKQKSMFELLGFFLILLSMLALTTETAWPSYSALLPVVGAMLILIAGKQDSIFTKHKVIQEIGNSSYSIYLWHWPIVFFMGYLAIDRTPFNLFVAISLSMLLGWLSYKYIENTTRKHLSSVDLKKGYFIITSITLILCFSYFLIFKTGGAPYRAGNTYLEKTKSIQMPLPQNGYCFYSVDSIPSLQVGHKGTECYIGSTQLGAKKAILFGDSYAAHNIPFWGIVGKDLKVSVNPVSTNWCSPGLGESFVGPKTSRAYKQCLYNRKFIEQNVDNYDLVIIAASWEGVFSNVSYESDFKSLISFLNKHHKKVVIMQSPYAYDNNLGNVFKRSVWLNNDFKIDKYIGSARQKRVEADHHRLDKLISTNSNIMVLKQEDLYSKSQTSNGVPYSLDGGHISIYGSLSSAEYFETTDKYRDLSNFITK